MAKLSKRAKAYREKTRRMITLEYVLIKDVNNSKLDADRLSKIAKRLKAKVNLIGYSRIPDFEFSPPGKEGMAIFADMLASNSVSVTIRESKGADIQAACGQLACRDTN